MVRPRGRAAPREEIQPSERRGGPNPLTQRQSSGSRRQDRNASQDNVNDSRVRGGLANGRSRGGSPTSKGTHSTSTMTAEHSSRSGRRPSTPNTTVQQNRTTTTMDFSRTADRDSFRQSVGSITHTRDSEETEVNPPSQIYLSRSQSSIDKARQMRMTIQAFVTNSLFPYLKFITDPDQELRYSDDKNSICGLVLEACNVVGDQQQWWASAKNIVRQKLSAMRNNKNSAIKVDFFSKPVFICWKVLVLRGSHSVRYFLTCQSYCGGYAWRKERRSTK